MSKRRNNRNVISITYSAKPDVPQSIHHTFPIMQSTVIRTRKFEMEAWQEAWKFMSECTNCITTLRQLVFAIPRKTGKKLLNLLDEKVIIDENGRWIDYESKDEEIVLQHIEECSRRVKNKYK